MGGGKNTYLLTGCTGFLGRCVLYRLLDCQQRSEETDTIWCLARPRKDQSAHERIQRILKSPPFDELSSETVKVWEVADLSSCALREDLLSTVTHVVHCAASISFTLPIREAYSQNVVTSRKVARMAQNCPLLVSWVHVSTAYVGPYAPKTVPEELTPRSGSVEEWEEGQRNGHFNTYTYTKNMAEHELDAWARSHSLPLKIVRPSVIGPAAEYPYEGYITALSAVCGIIAIAGTGLLHVGPPKERVAMNVVPVDAVVRVIEKALQSRDSARRVYHAVQPTSYGETGTVVLYRGTKYFDLASELSPFACNPYNPHATMYGIHHWLFDQGPKALLGNLVHTMGSPKDYQKWRRLAEKLHAAKVDVIDVFGQHRYDFAVTEYPCYNVERYQERLGSYVQRELLHVRCETTCVGGARHKFGSLVLPLLIRHAPYTILRFGIDLPAFMVAGYALFTIDSWRMGWLLAQVAVGLRMYLAVVFDLWCHSKLGPYPNGWEWARMFLALHCRSKYDRVTIDRPRILRTSLHGFPKDTVHYSYTLPCRDNLAILYAFVEVVRGHLPIYIVSESRVQRLFYRVCGFRAFGRVDPHVSGIFLTPHSSAPNLRATYTERSLHIDVALENTQPLGVREKTE